MDSEGFLSARDVVRAASARQRPPALTRDAMREHALASVLRMLGHAESERSARSPKPGAVELPASAWQAGVEGPPDDALTDGSAPRSPWGSDEPDPDSGSAVSFPDEMGGSVAPPDGLLGTPLSPAQSGWPTAAARYQLFRSRALGASPQAPAAGGGDSSATDGDDYGYDSPGLLGGAEPGAPPGLAQSDWPAAATQNEPFQPRAVAPFLKAPPTGGDDCPSTDSDDYGHDSPAGLGGGGEQSASLLVEVIPVPDDEIRREAMRSVAAMIDGLAAEINGLRQEMFSSQAARNAIFSRLSGV